MSYLSEGNSHDSPEHMSLIEAVWIIASDYVVLAIGFGGLIIPLGGFMIFTDWLIETAQLGLGISLLLWVGALAGISVIMPVVAEWAMDSQYTDEATKQASQVLRQHLAISNVPAGS